MGHWYTFISRVALKFCLLNLSFFILAVLLREFNTQRVLLDARLIAIVVLFLSYVCLCPKQAPDKTPQFLEAIEQLYCLEVCRLCLEVGVIPSDNSLKIQQGCHRELTRKAGANQKPERPERKGANFKLAEL